MEEYPIYFGQELIGTAKVIQQGLYYRIRCLCNISGSVPFRVTVTARAEADLGLCVPMGEYFGMETSIPVKLIGQGELQFKAMPRHAGFDERIIISPEEPFAYINRLKNAYLVKKGKTAMIGFRTPDQSPALPDNDQNP